VASLDRDARAGCGDRLLCPAVSRKEGMAMKIGIIVALNIVLLLWGLWIWGLVFGNYMSRDLVQPNQVIPNNHIIRRD
jgi:hypothetical protein